MFWVTSLLSERSGTAPRVCSHPEYTYTSGPEAAAVMATTGQVMDPWQCLALDHGLAERDDGRWACREVGVWVPRQNGKGAVIEAVVMHGLFVMGYAEIVWTAHETKTAAKGFARIRRLIKASPELLARVKIFREGNGKEGVDLHAPDAPCANAGPEVNCSCESVQHLAFIARSKGSGRGFSGDLVILDEAQFLTELEMRALFSTMSARPNAQIWYFGTPPESATAWIYGLKEDGERGKPRLCWIDYGQDAKDLGYDVATGQFDVGLLADRERWWASNPSMHVHRPDGSGVTEEFCEDELSRLQQGFAAERLGAWLPRAKGSGAIPEELWRDAAVPADERPKDVALAIVVNHKRTHTAILAVGGREDGRLQMSIVDYRPGTHWVIKRAADLVERWKPLCWVVQDKGPSATLIAGLADIGIKPPDDPEKPKRGDLLIPWANHVANAYGVFMDLITQSGITHLDESPMNIAVVKADTRPLGSGTAWDYKIPEIAPLIAGTLGAYGYVTWLPLVKTVYDPLANIW